MRRTLIWLMTIAALLVALGGPAAGAANAASTTSAARHGVVASPRADRRADATAITFSEYAVGTVISSQYQAAGVAFTNAPRIASDGANPTSPVLSGPGGFETPIKGRFVSPATGAPTTVSSLTVDVGYIDDRDSTRVVAFDRQGNAVQTVYAQRLGINTLTLTYAGMASFVVESVSSEGYGFAIDNLAISGGGDPQVISSMAAMGDSYSSGEGLLQGQGVDYDCATDMPRDVYWQDTNMPWRWGSYWALGYGLCDTRTLSAIRPSDLSSRPPATQENRCHRNGAAYPVRISRMMHADRFIFVACSGATTANLGYIPATAKPQYPQSPVNVAGGHAQGFDVNNFKASIGGDPDLVTVGVGGNDAGFADIAAHCLKALNPCSDDVNFHDAVINRIHGPVFKSLKITFANMRADFPKSTVVAFGYVSPVSYEAGNCLQAYFIPKDLDFLGSEVLATLNQTISDAAAATGVAFVNPAAVTEGHELCSKESWFRGLSFPIQQSFHPTQRAHQEIAEWFGDHYLNADGKLLLHDPAPAGSVIAPSVNNTPGNIVPLNVLTPSGGCLQGCSVQLQSDGYAPRSTGRIVLVSDSQTAARVAATPTATVSPSPSPTPTPTPVSPGIDLGRFTADESGRVDVTVMLPPGVTSGPQLISMDGTAPDGAPQYATTGFDVVTPLAAPTATVVASPVPAATSTLGPAVPTSTPTGSTPAAVRKIGFSGRRIRAKIGGFAVKITCSFDCRGSVRITARGGRRSLATGSLNSSGAVRMRLRPSGVRALHRHNGRVKATLHVAPKGMRASRFAVTLLGKRR